MDAWTSLQGSRARRSRNRRRCRGFVALLVVCAVGAVDSATVAASEPTWVERNSREGLAAQTAFEVVAIDAVSSSATYPLDPAADAYDTSGPTLSQLRYVTLAPVRQGDEAAFLFDLYVHGEREDRTCPVFRIPRLDLRKFLHQSLASGDAPPEVVQLQAYFAEFARKAKIVYPLPADASRRPHWSAYDEVAVPALRRRLEEVLATGAMDTSQAERFRELGAEARLFGAGRAKGSVPIWNSARVVRPSPSWSTRASAGSLGSRPLATSQSSGRPSPSVSADAITSIRRRPSTPSRSALTKTTPLASAVATPSGATLRTAALLTR